MKHSIIALSFMLPISAMAQTTAERAAAPLLIEGANFFVSIVAGVLLAIAFQLLLTALSVAGGITAIGNLKEKGDSSNDKGSRDHDDDDDDDDGMNMGQKISTGFGAWTMITTSIALFFASMLAVQLGLVGANFIGATLGLVIWAAFFIAMTYLEISAISSLVGGLISTVKSALTTTFSTAGSAFSKSDASASKEVARTSAKAQAREMRKQFEKLFSTHDVDRKLDEYVQQLKPQRIDINNVKNQIKDLLTDLQVTEKADFDYPNSVKKMILEEADKSTLSKEDKEAIKNHVSGLKDIAQSDASNEEKAKKGIEQLTPADREQINKYQDQIKKALQNTDKDELQPEKLEQDIKKILDQPGAASNIVKSKASAMDRDTLIKLMASQNMSEQDAEKYVDKVEGALKKVSSFFGNAQGQASSQSSDIQAKIKNMFSDVTGGISSGSSGGSSFSMDKIYSDVTGIFQSSGDTGDLKYKLQHYNKDEMTALVAKKTGMSRTESEGIADTIVSARDAVIEKANQVEAKVNEQMTRAKKKSLAAAEETRKTAVTAAWWLVATAILSGVASAIGGMLALDSWFF